MLLIYKHLSTTSSFTLLFLGIAITDGSVDSTRVYSVRTGVVLDGATSLESCCDVDECVAVYGEWTITGSGFDGWSWASEGTCEGLDVGWVYVNLWSLKGEGRKKTYCQLE
jgi:hypothetical protein